MTFAFGALRQFSVPLAGLCAASLTTPSLSYISGHRAAAPVRFLGWAFRALRCPVSFSRLRGAAPVLVPRARPVVATWFLGPQVRCRHHVNSQARCRRNGRAVATAVLAVPSQRRGPAFSMFWDAGDVFKFFSNVLAHFW